ncbi:hypothetical protein [Moellerella wisconsensis]|uniref:Uncharacterized protein n=1 Tax=Moellerella wisconsensis TaxID=158849 RepID=A0ACD3YDF3_9GAMM|nr:hypothetical protein [Moellerella wisconsensis]KLN95645.1 hypothetical protein VK86_14125 [Moellerella wisconsensis]UNH40985.1 hypothetical protein MNY70_18105 [Moellerella wisconsensis]WJW83846.1 hypothetical protein QU516_17610 [Moellerella wisconsensis]
MINSELPKVDVTYGINRFNERIYRGALTLISNLAKAKNKSVKVTKLNGEIFTTNPVKINARRGVVVFSDRRMLLAEIATVEVIERREFDESDSKTQYFDKSTLPKFKTFHPILRKAHATKKDVSVLLKSGKIYKGFSFSHDLDSLQIATSTGQVLIMYDAVKRIVPLEDDGSLAE